MLIFTTILIIVTIYIAVRRRNATHAQKELWQEFREREQQANWTRKQDISNLPYIQIPLHELPLGKHPDETLAETEQSLRALADQPICNLNGLSNTELKLRYGVANLETLSQCDTNYSTLVALLANYAEKLSELSYNEDAKTILEYAVSIGSDVGKSYELLATLYEYEHAPEKIQTLYESAEKLSSIRRDAILRKLKTHLE